ncbi:tRNA (adenosine(37)-N6)-threonylcarbamoyltransferase complex ATPase subunit type 1 TsaE [Candidatus Dependentiae bacterium]|nr:tRNA (adenosine(37)-N6)-threonylcarbamoyltransferase complex ATPase subunit type 1 TsaE [Candidatus Dependentiae bacterium]
MKIQYSLQEVSRVAERLKVLLAHHNVITFTGTLGAGKTTLIRELLGQLGVEGPVTSPTFNYVNGYGLPDGRMVYHFDLYRINSLSDFLSAGFGEYIYAPNSVCLIEWPQIIMPLLDHAVCHITLDYDSPQSRIISYSCLT